MELYESILESESHLFSVFLRRRWWCWPAIDGGGKGWIRVQDGEGGSQELTDPLLRFGPGIYTQKNGSCSIKGFFFSYCMYQ